MEFIEIKEKILYDKPHFDSIFFKDLKVIFADDTATGRPCPIIDKVIEKKILPYYANTHSNAFCANFMTECIDRTKKFIREDFNLRDDQVMLFTGSGATGASNHLVNVIDTEKYKNVNIFISIYEHHSNFLPWIELAKKKNNVHVIVIKLNKYEDIDIEWLNNQLKKVNSCNNLNIVSITGCSNVTGVITDIKQIYNITKQFKNNYFLFVDYACLVPYKKINANYFDGCFFSGHKLLGGQTSPGVLIAPKKIFEKGPPYTPGGGCVIRADSSNIIYNQDIESKESAGTPNIVGIIRLFYALNLKDRFLEIINNNEQFIVNYIHMELNKFINPNFGVIMLMEKLDHRLPIIALYSKVIHYNLIVMLLNDLFGIQTRGGLSCAGLLGEYCHDKLHINGWCRITFSWTMTKSEIDYILNAIKFIINYGIHFKKYYSYNKKLNSFSVNTSSFDPNLPKLLEKIKTEFY